MFFSPFYRLAGDFLKTEYLFVVVGQVGGACSDVQQSVLQVSQYDKRNKLVEILQSIGKKLSKTLTSLLEKVVQISNEFRFFSSTYNSFSTSLLKLLSWSK